MPEPVCRHLEVATDRDVLILTIVEPELFADNVADGLRRELHAALSEHALPKIALDFRNVRFVTTIAFQPLLSLRRKVHETGKQLVICGLSPEVAEVFDVTRLIATRPGMIAAFDHEADLAAALRRLQSA